MDGLGDEDLVDLAIGGDEKAFGLLLERHYDLIYRVAYRICRVQADAEEIAQTVCEKLGRAIAGFGRHAAFSSWLYSVTVNAARDFLRARNRRDRRSRPLEDAETASAGAIDATALATPAVQDGAVLRRQVWDRVGALPERQRLAVILVYGEGLRHEQAAEILGCAAGTVGWHIHQAIARLRAEIDPDDESRMREPRHG